MTRSSRAQIANAVAIAMLASAALAGCGKTQVETVPPVRPVKTIVVGGAYSMEMTFPAIVEAGEKAVLSFRVGGRLVELPIDEGQEVSRGQLIARLDPRDYQIELDRARAEFNKAEADLTRYQRLYEREAIPLSDLELRRSQRDVANAQLESAQRNLEYTRLTAPFDGQIGRRYVENFMDVTPQQDIVDLNDLHSVEIIVDLPERLVRSIQQGLKAEVYAVFANVPDRRFDVTFKEASSRADPETQTFKVRFQMPQPDDIRLLPGMTAEVQAVVTAPDSASVARPDRLVVPAAAVVSDPSGHAFVWVVDTGSMTVHKQPVQAGEMTGAESIHIVSGLSGGERVVTAGLSALEEGMEVSFWVRERHAGQT